MAQMPRGNFLQLRGLPSNLATCSLGHPCDGTYVDGLVLCCMFAVRLNSVLLWTSAAACLVGHIRSLSEISFVFLELYLLVLCRTLAGGPFVRAFAKILLSVEIRELVKNISVVYFVFDLEVYDYTTIYNTCPSCTVAFRREKGFP